MLNFSDLSPCRSFASFDLGTELTESQCQSVCARALLCADQRKYLQILLFCLSFYESYESSVNLCGHLTKDGLGFF